MVTVSFFALNQERTRHGGRARSPLLSKGRWSRRQPTFTRVRQPQSGGDLREENRVETRGSAHSGAPGLGSGAESVRAGRREDGGREERGRPPGGGAWPRCAALTRWHLDRWLEPAAAAAVALPVSGLRLRPLPSALPTPLGPSPSLAKLIVVSPSRRAEVPSGPVTPTGSHTAYMDLLSVWGERRRRANQFREAGRGMCRRSRTRLGQRAKPPRAGSQTSEKGSGARGLWLAERRGRGNCNRRTRLRSKGRRKKAGR